MAVTTQDQAQSPLGGSVLKSVSPQLLSWLVLGALAILCLVLREQYADLVKYPKELMLPIESWLEVGMDWFTLHFKPIFRFISSVLVVPMKGLEWLLHQMPWPFTMLVVAIVAYAAKGWKLSAFCLGALSYMLIVGYWDESMSTLALVGLSVPMSLLLGFTLGLMAFQFRGARRVIEPMLDVMQTVPTFAYLVPILILFGVGPRGRHGRVGHLCQPAGRACGHAGPWTCARQRDRKRPDVWLQPDPAPVPGAYSCRHPHDHGRCEPDHHGSPLHGHHCCHHRRFC